VIRSARMLGSATALIALAGMGVSAYLTYAHYADQSVACAVVHGCQTVQQSQYARLAGVPIALLGGLLYAGLLGSSAAWAVRGLWWWGLAAWFLALSGTAYSAYLTYLELEVIKAICVWCVTSAVLLAAALGSTSLGLPRILRDADEALNGRFLAQDDA
jgi:uncharacterized membrane protein